MPTQVPVANGGVATREMRANGKSFRPGRMPMSEKIVINEVGLRDGLQNQPRLVSIDEKMVMLVN